MHTKYKAVVFDFGGVIERGDGSNPLDNIARAINVPAENFKNEYFKHNHISNVENIPWEEMVLKVVAQFTPSKEASEKTLSVIREHQSKRAINTELVALFPRLRGQGYKVAILSNATSHLREKLKQQGL